MVRKDGVVMEVAVMQSLGKIAAQASLETVGMVAKALWETVEMVAWTVLKSVDMVT